MIGFQGVNGWLVLARCGVDDVPMVMVQTREHAVEYAKLVTEKLIQQQAERVYDVDVSVFYNVGILEIREGLPQLVETIKMMAGDPELTGGED